MKPHLNTTMQNSTNKFNLLLQFCRHEPSPPNPGDYCIDKRTCFRQKLLNDKILILEYLPAAKTCWIKWSIQSSDSVRCDWQRTKWMNEREVIDPRAGHIMSLVTPDFTMQHFVWCFVRLDHDDECKVHGVPGAVWGTELLLTVPPFILITNYQHHHGHCLCVTRSLSPDTFTGVIYRDGSLFEHNPLPAASSKIKRRMLCLTKLLHF